MRAAADRARSAASSSRSGGTCARDGGPVRALAPRSCRRRCRARPCRSGSAPAPPRAPRRSGRARGWRRRRRAGSPPPAAAGRRAAPRRSSRPSAAARPSPVAVPPLGREPVDQRARVGAVGAAARSIARTRVVEGDGADAQLARGAGRGSRAPRAARRRCATGATSRRLHRAGDVGGEHHRGALLGHRHRRLGPGQRDRHRRERDAVEQRAAGGGGSRAARAPPTASARGEAKRGRARAPAARRPARRARTASGTSASAQQEAAARGSSRAALGPRRQLDVEVVRRSPSRETSTSTSSPGSRPSIASDTSSRLAHRAAVDAGDHVAGCAARRERPGCRGRPPATSAPSRVRRGRHAEVGALDRARRGSAPAAPRARVLDGHGEADADVAAAAAAGGDLACSRRSRARARRAAGRPSCPG